MPTAASRTVTPPGVLVCGTNYGRSYLAAISLSGGAYRLAGILARGSSRSEAVAGHYGVPLFRHPDEVPGGIEIACAAMGPPGTDVVLKLLDRGTHVLCEHPAAPETVKRALRTAANRGVCFHVNGHFADLPAPRAFVKRCRAVGRSSAPRFVDLLVTDRSLYSGLDILQRALRGLAPCELDRATRRRGFCTIRGAVRGVEASVTVQCGAVSPGSDRLRLEDRSADYLIDHRLTVGFAGGTLTLVSTCGPVVWSSTLGHALHTTGPMWTCVSGEAQTAAELQRERVRANLRAIHALAAHARGGVAPLDQRPAFLLQISEAWSEFGKALSAAHSSHGDREEPGSLD